MSKERFVQLAKQIEQQLKDLNSAREELNTIMTNLGLNFYVQDPETLVVYKIIKPLGTFTYYRDIDYKRTALEGEKGGTVLAKKEAEEAGFRLK